MTDGLRRAYCILFLSSLHGMMELFRLLEGQHAWNRELRSAGSKPQTEGFVVSHECGTAQT